MKTFLKSETFNLAVFSGFALMVLCYRFKQSENFQFIFLCWNLLLAWIPYFVTRGLDKSQSKIIVALKLFLWLLFLPNAPYLITDMLHLHPRHESPYWLDTFILFVFAFNGMILFYASVRSVWTYFNALNWKFALFFMPICLGLCSYGIYMGRWLRFNSWDAVHHPFRLTRTMFTHTFNDANLFLIVQVTLIFSTMLLLSYRLLRSLR